MQAQAVAAKCQEWSAAEAEVVSLAAQAEQAAVQAQEAAAEEARIKHSGNRSGQAGPGEGQGSRERAPPPLIVSGVLPLLSPLLSF